MAEWRLNLKLIRLKGIYLGLLVLSVGWTLNAAAQLPSDHSEEPAPAEVIGQSDLTKRPAVINPTAHAMLDQVIQALGGQAFLSFKRLTTSGRAFSIADEVTVGLVPYESAVEYPDKRHSSYGKKQPVVLINNGDKGWEIDRYGLTRQRRAELRSWQLANRYSLENLLRVRTHEPGILVQSGGADFVDHAPVRIVTMVDALQTEIKLYFHSKTLLPVRITYHTLNADSKDWDDYADVYSDYRNIQGIQTPMRITRFLNGDRVGEIYRNSAKYDENYPAGYFDEPQR